MKSSVRNYSLALRETRRGEDWAEVLKQGQDQGLNLVVVVKDAAKGIEAGSVRSSRRLSNAMIVSMHDFFT